MEVKVDLLAYLPVEFFENWLIEQAAAHPKKTVAAVLAGVLRKGLAQQVCVLAGMGAEQTIGQMSKPMRKELVRQAKELPLTITATRPIEEAIVTRGGVDIQQIDSKTMESKICPGLYFAGRGDECGRAVRGVQPDDRVCDGGTGGKVGSHAKGMGHDGKTFTTKTPRHKVRIGRRQRADSLSTDFTDYTDQQNLNLKH